MNNLLVVALIILMVFITCKAPETYESHRAAYRYGWIDTNPMNRVSGPFDGCPMTDPYEGLPLP